MAWEHFTKRKCPFGAWRFEGFFYTISHLLPRATSTSRRWAVALRSSRACTLKTLLTLNTHCDSRIDF